ncbi:MAG: helix-turn-helix transcriptional regulator [Synergistaceae bacterium]|nr:helix-turn-helix transcriptional regulator [Synergistaceae bacterium]
MINIKGLRAIRKKRGLTLQQLGDLTGIDFNSISRYERGVLVPNVRTIEKIASALNVTTDELLNGPKNESWTLEIKFDNSQKELVNMTADFPCISSVTGSKFGAVLTLSGKWDTFKDDAKFQDFVDQLIKARDKILKMSEDWC